MGHVVSCLDEKHATKDPEKVKPEESLTDGVDTFAAEDFVELELEQKLD